MQNAKRKMSFQIKGPWSVARGPWSKACFRFIATVIAQERQSGFGGSRRRHAPTDATRTPDHGPRTSDLGHINNYPTFATWLFLFDPIYPKPGRTGFQVCRKSSFLRNRVGRDALLRNGALHYCPQ